MAIEFQNVEMSYEDPAGKDLPVFNIKEWSIPEAAQIAILGPSGSGKTTILHLISGIRLPKKGSIRVSGQDIVAMPESARDLWRSKNLGYIFQNYYLFPALTLLENTIIPLTFAGWPGGDRTARAAEILQQLELDHRLSFYPHQLSSGEKQRAVIARALVNRPKILLADEPSANLDSNRRRLLTTLLKELAERHHATLIVATHDQELAAMFSTRVEIGKFK